MTEIVPTPAFLELAASDDDELERRLRSGTRPRLAELVGWDFGGWNQTYVQCRSTFRGFVW